ncbi:Hypothetical predicted protein [Paramuricea clavata]|uniref:Uncharacterized protein n=1 Tax=Paramuricea clavata TaxID=317549 RepID=A0A6S7I118_PARCT|nr:Hypothetical predicted protein [Paramuricea clavata]
MASSSTATSSWQDAFNLDLLSDKDIEKYLFSNNKGNLKWYGDFVLLQELFDHLLQHQLIWSKPGSYCRKLEGDGFTIRWYSDNGTLTVSEAKEEKIKRYLQHISTKEPDSIIDICRIKEADNFKSPLSRDQVKHITEENIALKAENAALKEKVDYAVLVMSDLNTKLKLLEEEKQSLITALNILQVNEFKSNTQNPGQYVLANIQNEKSQPEQLEISSDSEYNIPLANRYSTLADEGKLNEDESEQTTQQQGQASVITMELNVQQQQQQSTCNQSSEQCNSDVRVDNQQGQLREPASNEPPNNGNSKGTKQAEMAKTKGRIRPVDSRNSVNQGTSKSNSDNEMGSQGKSTLVIGDSMIKEIEVNKLSRSKKITKICMPGAKSDQIKERLQTTLKSTHYDEVIIHAGVNDLSNSQPDQIIVQLTDMAASVNSSTKVSISSIITTRDKDRNSAINLINSELKITCQSRGWVYIDNSRIGNEHLKFNSIHLNRVGVKLFASNIIRQSLRPGSNRRSMTKPENFPNTVWRLAKALNMIAQIP